MLNNSRGFFQFFFSINLENRKTYGIKKIRAQNVYAQNISLSDNCLGSYPEDVRRHAHARTIAHIVLCNLNQNCNWSEKFT